MAKDEIKEENTAPSNFIEDFIDEDLKEFFFKSNS